MLLCNKRHYFVCIFCLGHRFFLSFPEESPVSLFSWWEGGSCRTWPSRGHSTQRGGHLLHPPFPPLLCFFLFLCLNEAALPSASLPSGAERIRVQSHQRTSASAHELFVLPLLSVSWEANLLIVCIMTFGWQPQWGRNQHPDDNNVIISEFNYEGCAGI